MKYCRYILEVSKKAPNNSLYGDTGRFPLSISAILGFNKYWHRVANISESDNKLLYTTYCENVTKNSMWFQSVTRLLEHANLNAAEACRLILNSLTRKVVTYLKKEFIKGWKTDLFDDSRKSNSGNKF